MFIGLVYAEDIATVRSAVIRTSLLLAKCEKAPQMTTMANDAPRTAEVCSVTLDVDVWLH